MDNVKAKQEAVELVNSFMPYIYCYLGSGMLVNEYNEDVARLNAKHCAIISVNEKIKTCKKFYSALSYPAEVRSDSGYVHFEREAQYLAEVLKQINEL